MTSDTALPVELDETRKRLQEILDYFDAEASEAMANETERGHLWSDIEIPVGDLRTVLRALSATRTAVQDCIDAIAAEIGKPIEGPEHGAWDRGRRDGLRAAVRILSALSTRTDLWEPIETAPVACTVLATYFDHEVGEWIVQIVVADRAAAPFTHWTFIDTPGEDGRCESLSTTEGE